MSHRPDTTSGELPFGEPAFARVFGRPRPRWFNIPAHRPFVEDLARGLVEILSPIGPEALSDAIVLTPTRRGMRSLTEAFVQAAGGKATLLPQIRALGDLDEGEPPFEPGDLAVDLPPAVSALRRRFELARLIHDHAHLLERDGVDARDALDLADSLGAFLDSVQIEEVGGLDRLAGLVEGDMAEHWIRSVRFLSIATELWPKRLEDLGLVDVNVRRTRLLRVLADQWTHNPPPRALIAAGSTGTAPATAELLKVIANAPQGCVVLPGLDQELEDKAWDEVRDAHPQGALKRLLERAGITRADVQAWPNPDTAAQAVIGRSRRRVINEALRPAEVTNDWLVQIDRMLEEGRPTGVNPVAEGLDGLSLIHARDEIEAADIAALALRETLETPGATAALVTPDAVLARRVSAALTRWGIEADSSAGQGLGVLPVGMLLGLMARAAARPMDPVLLLALLKHRFTRLGYAPLALSARARTIERFGLRGVAPRDRDMLLARLKDHADAKEAAGRLLDCVALAAEAFRTGPARAPDAMRAIAEAMEKLAIDDRGAPGDLWAGPGGESAASLIAGVLREAEPLPPCDAATFAGLVERLVADETVRSGGASHPRLRILGAMEARLVRADRLILAGLEEGTWPQSPRLDPFLSRPMRTALGLPPPERRIGLSAHDFAQAACAPQVLLIASERRDGQPAVRSRWLWRLETLAKGAGAAIDGGDALRAWRRSLDQRIWPAPPELAQATRPAPTPPLAARPRQLPVTAVETWVRDPYAVYARRILNLRPMDRPAKPFDNRTRGTAIHKATETFAAAWPMPGKDPAQVFAADYLAQVAEAGATATDLVREGALAVRTGAWMTDFERQRRSVPMRLVMEETGEMLRPGPQGPFKVTAKADRLEVVGDRVNVLDFKTGAPPSEKEVEAGFSPQLTLTAAIVRVGGYEKIGPARIGALTYVRLTGRGEGGDTRDIGEGREDELADTALEGLDRWIARFDDPDQPYVSRLAVKFMSSPSDYDHLARRQEWASGDADGGDE
jgi:ATP-dependent helicase/nuclease subunit B